MKTGRMADERRRRTEALSRIPLSEPHISGNEWRYVKECLDTGWVSSAGSFVERFEAAVAAYTGARHAVSCVNGTAALQIALRLAGVGTGDEVAVPTLTFIAPVNAVKYQGAEPVFMDCDEYMNIDPEKFDDFCRTACVVTRRGLKNRRSGRLVKAVLPVHIFGNPCRMDDIARIADRYALTVVEDATESMGSYYTAGRFAGRFTGTVGSLGVYSFNGNKIITTGGGGMIVSGDRRMADKARYLVTQAKDDGVRYVHNDIGYNFRLPNIPAALGVAQLERLEEFITIKKRNYERYASGLEGVRGVSLLGVPPGTRPNYWLYTLIVEKDVYGADAETVLRRLWRKNIEARPIWKLNHLQKPYRRNRAYRIARARRFYAQAVSLPSSTTLRPRQIDRIIAAIADPRKG